MKARRKALKTINLLRGQPETEIAFQSDGMANNPLYSGIGKTPFQPATQCSYSIVENVTKKKQVIVMEKVIKLCTKHGYHTLQQMRVNVTLSKKNAEPPYQWSRVLEIKDNGQHPVYCR